MSPPEEQAEAAERGTVISDSKPLAGEDAASAEASADATPLPPELAEALRAFEGDFRGPWRALGLGDDEDLVATPEEIRTAYRRAVREEHPDRSKLADAEARFQKVRSAYALLADEGSRALLLEAMELDVESFEELPPEDAAPGGVSASWWFAAVIVGFIAGAAAWLLLAAPPPVVRRAEVTAQAELVRESAKQTAPPIVAAVAPSRASGDRSAALPAVALPVEGK